MLTISISSYIFKKYFYIFQMEHLSKNSDLQNSKSFFSASTAKSGIFTTFAQTNKESQFKKSCISHLPGSYHKVDLGGKLNFVVVFQAIQIQRLSVQVQNLRVLLKDSERQVATYLNYQVQIKQLTESYHQLQEQLKNYQCELQKMSLACNALYEENSQTKKVFQKQQNESLQLINSLQKKNDQLKSNIEEAQQKFKELSQGDKQTQRRNKLISQELVRLNQNLLLGQNQLGDLRQNYAKQKKELQKCIQEIKRWEACAKEQKEKSILVQQKIKQNQQQIQRQFYNVQAENQRLQQQLAKAENFIKQAENELDNRGQQLQEAKKILNAQAQQISNVRQNFQNERKVNENLKRQFDSLQRQADQIKRQIQGKDSAHKELNQYFSQLKNELAISKAKAQQLSRLISELKNRIEQGYNQISKMKQIIQSYSSQIQKSNLREQELVSKIANLQLVLKENNKMNNQIAQLNTRIGEKQDDIFTKGQEIAEISMENKQLNRQIQSLQNNTQNLGQCLKQLETTLDRERQTFQSEKAKLTQEYQKLINRQKEERNKIQKQLAKLKQQGLIHQSTKVQVASLKNSCQKQAQEIKNLTYIIENASKLLQKLKEKNKEYKEVEKTNENLRKQLSNSISMNERLIDSIGTQLTEISSLIQEVYSLEEKLRLQKDKNDDFMSSSIQKTMISTQSSREPLTTKVQAIIQPSSYNFASNYTKQRYSPPQLTQFNLYNASNDRKANQKSYSNYETNAGCSNPLKKPLIIGKLDLTSTTNNLSKSVMVNEGVLFESRKVLEPSTYFPAREGKEQNYKGNLSYRESASSAYEQFKRQRRL